MAEILWRCLGINLCRMIIFVQKSALSAAIYHQLAVTTFSYQLGKFTSWQMSKTQSSCQLKITAYWIFLSQWVPILPCCLNGIIVHFTLSVSGLQIQTRILTSVPKALYFRFRKHMECGMSVVYLSSVHSFGVCLDRALQNIIQI